MKAHEIFIRMTSKSRRSCSQFRREQGLSKGLPKPDNLDIRSDFSGTMQRNNLKLHTMLGEGMYLNAVKIHGNRIKTVAYRADYVTAAEFSFHG